MAFTGQIDNPNGSGFVPGYEIIDLSTPTDPQTAVSFIGTETEPQYVPIALVDDLLIVQESSTSAARIDFSSCDVPCSLSDRSAPFGVLDLADIQAFIPDFVSSNVGADLAIPFGVLDLADIQLFIQSFNAGCP